MSLIKYLIVLFLFNGMAFSQSVVPYFIMAYKYTANDEPYNYNGSIGRKPFSTYILFLEKDSLKNLKTISTLNNLELRGLINLPELNLIYFEEALFESSNIDYMSILDYNKDILLRKFVTKFDTSFANSSYPWSMKINGKLIFCNERKRIREDYYLWFGRDMFFNKYSLVSKNFNDLYLLGIPGFQRNRDFGYPFQYLDNDNLLKIPYKDIYGNYPETWIHEPTYLKNSSVMYAEINNENYFVGGPQIESNPTDSTINVKILNKKSKEWQTVEIPGLLRIFSIYKDWMYGTAKTFEERKWFISKNIIKENYLRRYDTIFGKLPDLQYYPGILYLFNITAKKMIKWNTGDRDSEIITINDDVIYYRVFDEIRTVKLDTKRNEIEWSSQKVLVKDKKRVPNIHWMFFAPKQDRVEEIWVNKPKEKKKK